MKAKKILFITQEIVPYVNDSQMAVGGREIPQSVQDGGFEIRTFMPRWGNINERRNQLHEVIRLSGMNIIIDDTDHPLIIKVASIQQARMQVYFIDNDDYFHKRQMMTDEHGEEYPDNAERAIFYARGVLETVKKLRWAPDVIHCHGWMSTVVPLYLRTAYSEEPTFEHAKIVTSIYDEQPQLATPENFVRALSFRSATQKLLTKTGIDFTKPESLYQLAIHFSDGVVQSSAHSEYSEYAAAQGIPVVECPAVKDSVDTISDLYRQLVGEDEPEEED